MKTTCSWKGCNQPRNKKEVYCTEHRREYQRMWRRGITKKAAAQKGDAIIYEPLSDEQATEIWRKADQNKFGEYSAVIMKMAEDLMTWNAERRLGRAVQSAAE